MRSSMAGRFVAMGAAFALPALIVSSRGLAQIQSIQSRSEPSDEAMARRPTSVPQPSASGPNGSTPVLNESAKLTASDAAALDYFGVSVSVSGDTAIVGAYGDDCASGNFCGSAYIFRFNGTSWIEEQRLTASDAAADDEFGISVSVSGDAAIVGAPGAECGNGENCGAAYVFRFNGNVWVEEKKLTPVCPGSNGYFGSAVSLSGDAAAAGAPGPDCTGCGDCGRASVYRFQGGEWSHEQELTGSDARSGDLFGISVSLSGNLCVAGAWLDDCAAGIDCGSGYIYQFNGTDWVEQPKITASDAWRDDLFGLSISADGERVVVGAHWDDCNINTCCAPSAAPGCDDPDIEACVCADVPSCCGVEWSELCTHAIDTLGCGTCGIDCGSAYVFRFDGSEWVEEEQLVASDAAPNDWFGESVAMSGHWVVAAAPGQSAGHGAPIVGSAYTYRFNGDFWVEEHMLAGSDTQAGDRFGSDVSLNGATAIIGASKDDCAEGVDCGSAYVFRLARASDLDLDGDVDMIDYSSFLQRYTGDLLEFVSFQSEFTGPS